MSVVNLHPEDLLEIHPSDAENRGINDGDWVSLRSRAGETTSGRANSAWGASDRTWPVRAAGPGR